MKKVLTIQRAIANAGSLGNQLQRITYKIARTAQKGLNVEHLQKDWIKIGEQLIALGQAEIKYN
ncbi:MAG: hypothetical protein AABW84_02230 [Nanoarchaeota archaeon]